VIAVVIVDHPDSGANNVDLVAIARALERQVQEHAAPLLGVTCTVGVASAPVSGAWCIGLFKDADQPGALGYHDLTPDGLPLAKVFPLLDQQDGADLSVTISHELLEMLADPWLRLGMQTSDGRFYAYEACDAVEADSYDVDGVKVSNFVLPGWYGGGGKLDYLGLCTQPLEVRPGGYAQYYDPAQGWQQVVHNSVAPRAYRTRVGGRVERRARR
jgi:hypothetical protein